MLPQFPNVFYGTALLDDGTRAPAGWVVTAVLYHGTDGERHYALKVNPMGYYGSPNGPKLKVGGDGEISGMIPDGADILFFITDGELEYNTCRVPAGKAYFRNGGFPIFRVNLIQQPQQPQQPPQPL